MQSMQRHGGRCRCDRQKFQGTGQMSDVGIDTANDGKIAREEFFPYAGNEK